MRAFAIIVLGAAVGAGLQTAGVAQEAAPCTPGALGIGYVMNTSGRGAPFTAKVKNTFEQRLIDGNVISGESHTHVYQNSEGWTRTESLISCFRDTEGKTQWTLSVSVYKPKSRERLSWQEQADWSHFNRDATLWRPVEPTPEERAALAKARAESAAHPARRAREQQVKTESLGSATIAGLEVTGQRTTRTIEPGAEGNTLPLVTTNESWTTKDGMQVRLLIDDPRRGKSTVEVEEFIPGEPDAALFAPPQGYTLKEYVPPMPVSAATAKVP